MTVVASILGAPGPGPPATGLRRGGGDLDSEAWEPSSQPIAQGQVTFSVEDEGRGISPEIQKRLFEPYVTTKEPGKGTGLGLYLSRDVLQATGGTIELEPAVGATVFRVFLPCAK